MVASGVYHVAWCAVVLVLAADGTVGWAHAVVWVGLAVRAVVLQEVAARRSRPVRPVYLGVGEIVASLAVTLTLLVV